MNVENALKLFEIIGKLKINEKRDKICFSIKISAA